MNYSETRKLVAQARTRWGVVALSLVAWGALLAPGCKFESCADTKTCESEVKEPDDSSLGGQGGADDTSEGEEPEGMGGDDEEEDDEEEPDPEPELSCEEGEVLCVDDCIDPNIDLVFCGASGVCEGDTAGEFCGEGELCVDGMCELDCPSGQVACDGSCIDPLTDDEYCGAGEACEEFVVCEAEEQCISGICAAWGPADSVDFGVAQSDGPTPGHVTIDEAGEVLFAWARPNALGEVNAQTSQFILDPPLWSTPKLHDTGASPVSDLHMETNSSGRTVIVWSQASASIERVVWATVRDPGADFSEPVVISGVAAGAFTTWGVFSLALTLDEAGNAYAAWVEDQGASDVVAVNRLAADGSEWGRPVEVRIDEPVASSSRTPIIMSLADGEALLLFERAKQEGGWAWYSATSEGGKFGGNEFGTAAQAFETTQPGYSYGHSVATNGEEAILFWVAYAGSLGPQFGLTSFYRDGAWTEPAEIETPGGPNLFRLPQVAMDAEGNITAAWASGAFTSSLWSAVRAAGADEWIFTQEPVALGTTDVSFSELLLELDGLGNAQLAWLQDSGSSPRVWASRRRSGNTEFDTPRLVGSANGSFAGLAMDMNQSGQGILTCWTSTGTERTLWYSYFH